MAQDWVAAGIGAKPSAEAMEAKQAANAKAELEEELARAKSQAPGVVTWHDLIQQAIVLLRGMPEDSRHEAMNQWSSAVAVNVQFPGKSKHKQKAADGKTKAAAPAEATALKCAGQYPEAALAEDGGKYAVFKTESVTTAGKTVLLGYDVYFSPTGSTEEKDKLKLGRAKTSKAAKAIAEAHAAKKTKAEAKPPTAWSWTDTAIGFERLPGKKATVDGKTHTVYIGPRGKPVWTMSTGKRGQPSHKVLPPEVDTIEAAMAAVERLYAE
jgi:hypothetical protein